MYALIISLMYVESSTLDFITQQYEIKRLTFCENVSDFSVKERKNPVINLLVP